MQVYSYLAPCGPRGSGQTDGKGLTCSQSHVLRACGQHVTVACQLTPAAGQGGRSLDEGELNGGMVGGGGDG